jgi:hypothetical protein
MYGVWLCPEESKDLDAIERATGFVHELSQGRVEGNPGLDALRIMRVPFGRFLKEDKSMVASFFFASTLAVLLFSPCDFARQEKGDQARIKQILSDCQKKRTAAGSFRMDLEIQLDDKTFRNRTISHARYLSDGAKSVRVDLLEKDPRSNRTYVRTEKEVYFQWNGPGVIYPFSLPATLRSNRGKAQIGLGSQLMTYLSESSNVPLLMLDTLDQYPGNKLAFRLISEDENWSILEVIRPLEMPSWWRAEPKWVQTHKYFDVFQFKMDRKTGFAMIIESREQNGNETTYSVKSLETNLSKPVEEEFLRGLPIREMKRIGFPPSNQ